MEEDKHKQLESYGIKRPEDREKDLALEAELWEKIVEDPEDAERHKEYVGHAIRSGLLKEASRRYGPMVDDSGSYSIEARRQARFYQKQIVNLMFMTPTVKKGKEKNPAIGYILAFFSVMAILVGFLVLEFWYISLAGLFYLVPYIYVKFKQAQKKSERNHTPGSTSSQL